MSSSSVTPQTPTSSLSTKELKELITSAGLSYADCVEKFELRARAREALRLASGASTAARLSSPVPTTPTKAQLKAQLDAVTAELAASKMELAALRVDCDDEDTPAHLRCPITMQRMASPVSVADGHTFERSAIASWLEQRHTNPLTGAALSDARLVPALALRDSIRDWELRHGRAPAERPRLGRDEPRTAEEQRLWEERAARYDESDDDFDAPSSDEDLQAREENEVDAVLLEYQQERARQAERERRARDERERALLAQAERETEREAEREAERASWRSEASRAETSRINAGRVRDGLEILSPTSAIAWRDEQRAATANQLRAEQGLGALSPTSATAWRVQQRSDQVAARMVQRANAQRAEQGLEPASPETARSEARSWRVAEVAANAVRRANAQRAQQGLDAASPNTARAWAHAQREAERAEAAGHRLVRANAERAAQGLSPFANQREATDWLRVQDALQAANIGRLRAATRSAVGPDAAPAAATPAAASAAAAAPAPAAAVLDVSDAPPPPPPHAVPPPRAPHTEPQGTAAPTAAATDSPTLDQANIWFVVGGSVSSQAPMEDAPELEDARREQARQRAAREAQRAEQHRARMAAGRARREAAARHRGETPAR